MSLRGILTSAIAMLVGIALLSSVLLIVVTTSLHGAAVELGLAIESIRVAEHLQINLLLYDRDQDLAVRRDLRSELLEMLSGADKYVANEQEAQLLEDVRVGIVAFLEQSTEARLETALLALGSYTPAQRNPGANRRGPLQAARQLCEQRWGRHRHPARPARPRHRRRRRDLHFGTVGRGQGSIRRYGSGHPQARAESGASRNP